MKVSVTCLIYALFTHTSIAYPRFADHIPNGRAVPNPNSEGGIWAGAGHLQTGGSGPLNPFGEDIGENKFTWSDELCQADSDGDGLTNRVELGDSDCIWFAGGPDPKESALSHSGILDEPQELELMPCADYVEPNEFIEYDIGFSTPTSIEETRTHYICEQMEQAVPSSEVLHMIKSSVVGDNREVLHHMFVFFCFTDLLDGNQVSERPYECSGNESRCVRAGGWAVRPEETCTPPTIGEEYNFEGMEKSSWRREHTHERITITLRGKRNKTSLVSTLS